MTIEQFLKELSKTRRKWELDSISSIRSTKGCYCPITAVAQTKHKKYYDPYNYLEAGRRLGLNRASISKIISAADSEWTPVINLRAKLLQACHIER